jgi:hypothetical protein
MKTLNPSSLNPIRWLALGLLSAAAALPVQAITPAEATGVLAMKQEEKMARDVYQALAVRWDNAVFRNIAVSEQRHMDAMDALIARNGLVDPTPAEPGKFTIPELQKLHDDLVLRGGTSLTEALRVGVLIEETDIADLKEVLAVTQDATIQRVMGNLLRASGQHLRAFTSSVAVAEGTADASAISGACPKDGSAAGYGRGGRQATSQCEGAGCGRSQGGNAKGGRGGKGALGAACGQGGQGACTGTPRAEECVAADDGSCARRPAGAQSVRVAPMRRGGR